MDLKPGTLLIAPPTMTDPRFQRSVLLLTQHSEAGSFALCLNKPTHLNLQEITKEMGLDVNLPFHLFWGGPVQPSSVWMLHSAEWECSHTMYINDEWKITSNESMFHHMADGDAPRHFRTVYGFCSWAPNQLDLEMAGTPPFSKSSSWVTAKSPSPEDIFQMEESNIWDYCTTLAGKQAVDNWMA
jgi:putative transcriptional regulator